MTGIRKDYGPKGCAEVIYKTVGVTVVALMCVSRAKHAKKTRRG